MSGNGLRLWAEKEITGRTVDALLAAGFSLSVFDGEETTVHRSRSATKVKAALQTTDEDRLFVYKPSESGPFGWVRFIYGNDGWDVISDYTINLEDVLKPVNDFADTLS